MKLFFKYYTKTFKDIFANSAIFTTLILSVFLYSFFYPTAYKAQHAEFLPIVIVDEERSPLTQQIISEVGKSPNVRIKTITGNFAEAESLIKQQQVDGILLLPNNLSHSIRRGDVGGVGLYLSTANFLKTKQIGFGLAQSIESVLMTQTERFREISDFSPVLSVHQIPLFNTTSGYGSYIFPAIAPLIIHQTILLGLSMLIATYKERGWKPRKTEVFGIFTAILSIGCLGCFYLFGFTFWLYDYPRGGNFEGMLLAVPIYIGSVIGLSFLIASYFDMPERAGQVLVFTSIPLFMLSGAAWPHAAMPLWMQYLANIFPSTQAIQMFIQLNQMGVKTSIVLPKLIYLLGSGSIFLFLGVWRIRRSKNELSFAKKI